MSMLPPSPMRFTRPFLRWLIALVVLTSTPGLGEFFEGVVHAAMDDHSETHHETDCSDGCDARSCTQGLFHTCRCNASPLAPISVTAPLPVPTHFSIVRYAVTPPGKDQPAHRTPPFRPPAV